MTEKRVEELENRLNDMECQLAFQEQTIESLNDALSQQQLLITKMQDQMKYVVGKVKNCLLYTSPSPRDTDKSRMPSSA